MLHQQHAVVDVEIGIGRQFAYHKELCVYTYIYIYIERDACLY